jgi:hypothetical protein
MFVEELTACETPFQRVSAPALNLASAARL